MLYLHLSIICQVDYILGENPKMTSYMVGYGKNFPKHVHHRSSSIPSILVDTQPLSCDSGFNFYYASSENPNVLTGAVVGGPDDNDEYTDDRNNYAQSEPATYINAPLVGTLSYIAACFQ